MGINYSLICDKILLQDLPSKNRKVLIRRFGLGRTEKETLQNIGEDFGVTRERIRQIEKNGLEKLKEKRGHPQLKKAFKYFNQYFKKNSNLKREDILLAELGDKHFQNQVFFLLVLGENFKRIPETEEFYDLWTVDQNWLTLVKKALNSFESFLVKKNHPLALPQNFPLSYIEISKKIGRSPEGRYGLRTWPEINPKRVGDKVYLVIKREAKPLHFRKVAQAIYPQALPQTVHNELIKDSRFVLVGRGTYGLKEWGYIPGTVKEVILNILKKAHKPLLKEKIVKEVLSQRQIKSSTVVLNLNNKNYFSKDSKGRYTIRKA